MPATRSVLMARLAELGISTTTVDHDAVYTVAESSKLEHDIPGGHTKNLLLKDKRDQLYLVSALGSAVIDMKSLHKLLGSDRLSFAKPELLLDVMGVTPGSVTVFALMNDIGRRVNVVLDARLMEHATINCHPMENTATTNIARDDLLRFIRACGHEPRILPVDGGPR